MTVLVEFVCSVSQEELAQACAGYLAHPFRNKALCERSTGPILLAGEKRQG